MPRILSRLSWQWNSKDSSDKLIINPAASDVKVIMNQASDVEVWLERIQSQTKVINCIRWQPEGHRRHFQMEDQHGSLQTILQRLGTIWRPHRDQELPTQQARRLHIATCTSYHAGTPPGAQALVSLLMDCRQQGANWQVTIATWKDHSQSKQPHNIRYISAIWDLLMELRWPMQVQWIKGHQDERSSYRKLHPDAKLNVDELATLYKKSQMQNPCRQHLILLSLRLWFPCDR